MSKQSGPVQRGVARCTRCEERPGPFVWTAGSKYAEGIVTEIRLCELCVQALRSMLQAGRLKKLQRQQAAAAKTPKGAT